MSEMAVNSARRADRPGRRTRGAGRMRGIRGRARLYSRPFRLHRRAWMLGQEDLRRRLEELRSEHRDLDDVIAQLQTTAPFNQLQLQRLKKRKLALKDQII